MAKPTVSTDWALAANALKEDPNSTFQQRGWDTSDGTTSGIPSKPSLSVDNGWKGIINDWVDYVDEEIDDLNNIGTAIPTKYQDFYTGSVSIDTGIAQTTILQSYNNLTVGNWYKISVGFDFRIRAFSTDSGRWRFTVRFREAPGSNLFSDNQTQIIFDNLDSTDYYMEEYQWIEISWQAAWETYRLSVQTTDVVVAAIGPVVAENIRATIEEFDPGKRQLTSEWS